VSPRAWRDAGYRDQGQRFTDDRRLFVRLRRCFGIGAVPVFGSVSICLLTAGVAAKLRSVTRNVTANTAENLGFAIKSVGLAFWLAVVFDMVFEEGRIAVLVAHGRLLQP